ncbi:MAG: SPOR domain-containing protein, partial [Atribacterota bacterium]
VQVGAYQREEQAEEAAQELKDLGYEIWVTQR